MATPGHRAQDLNWLVTNFVERVPYVGHAVIVSSNGIPLAVSDGFPPDRAERLATVTCGLSSLVQGAARAFEGGIVIQTVVELDAGVMVVMTSVTARASRYLPPPTPKWASSLTR